LVQTVDAAPMLRKLGKVLEVVDATVEVVVVEVSAGVVVVVVVGALDEVVVDGVELVVDAGDVVEVVDVVTSG
jgi:hypothetical protein